MVVTKVRGQSRPPRDSHQGVMENWALLSPPPRDPQRREGLSFRLCSQLGVTQPLPNNHGTCVKWDPRKNIWVGNTVKLVDEGSCSPRTVTGGGTPEERLSVFTDPPGVGNRGQDRSLAGCRAHGEALGEAPEEV